LSCDPAAIAFFFTFDTPHRRMRGSIDGDRRTCIAGEHLAGLTAPLRIFFKSPFRSSARAWLKRRTFTAF
jgi:hypothetical protein